MEACHSRPEVAFLRGEHWEAFDSPCARVGQRHEVAVPWEATEVPSVPSLVHFHNFVAEALSLERILLYVANAASNSLIDVVILRVVVVAVAAAENWVQVVAAAERQVVVVVAAVAAVAIVSVEVQCFCHREYDSLQQQGCFVAVAKCFGVLDSRHVDLDEADSLLDGAADPAVDLAAIQRDCASAYSVQDCKVGLADCQDSREIGLEAHIVVNTEIAEDMDPFACNPSVACVVGSLACVRAVLVGPSGLPFVNPD